MIVDMLRYLAADGGSAFGPEALAALDLRTLGRVPAEWVTRDFRRRLGDQVWRVAYRRKGKRGDPFMHKRQPLRPRDCLFILLEFQSEADPNMAWRVTEYTVELYRALEAQGALGRRARRPAVLPIVVYNGRGAWTAPLHADLAMMPRVSAAVRETLHRLSFGAFEMVDFVTRAKDDPWRGNALWAQISVEAALASGDPARMAAALADVAAVRNGPLRRALLDWMRQLDDWYSLGLEKKLEELEEMGSLEAFDRKFEERFVATVRGWREKSHEQGMEEGIKEGIKEGMEQAMRRGVERERALLCRMATRRFGAEASERLSALLDGIGDPDRLEDIGELIVDCNTGAELLRRAEPNST